MKEERKIFGVSLTVFKLGIVSLLTDISSEMLVPIIPQFLRFVLGTPGQLIGLIEGIAESTASILRVYAGYLSDKFGKPKLLTVIGYGLSALSKPFLAFSVSWSQVLGVRFADRFGKGIRSAPRDVLIADASDESERGRAFGLHRSMDSLGATLGPLAVIILVACFFGQKFLTAPGREHIQMYRIIFYASAVPAILGWFILALTVPEDKKAEHNAKKPVIKLSDFDARYKIFLAIITLFAIGNSSDAFLVLRATSKPIGMNMLHFLLLYVSFNAVQTLISYRSGVLSDKIGRKPIAVIGWLIFSMVYFMIARTENQIGMWVWFIIYGIYYGMTEGILRAFAVDLAPAHLRGTAIGAYYTFTGLALLPASLIAGYLWDHVGYSAPFYYGAATSFAAAVLLWLLVKEPVRNGS